MDAGGAIQEQSLNLVFLDVQMPEMDGFEVIQAVGVERMPTVVFVTAYDTYALRAFEVHAVDYLLKPFDRERFASALDHAKSHIERRATGDLSERLLAPGKRQRDQAPAAFVVSPVGRFFLDVAESFGSRRRQLRRSAVGNRPTLCGRPSASGNAAGP